jgi:hypothetical protein
MKYHIITVEKPTEEFPFGKMINKEEVSKNLFYALKSKLKLRTVGWEKEGEEIHTIRIEA